MGALLGIFATFLGGALTSIVAWAAAALTSTALTKFLTFAAKIGFLLALMAIVVAYVTPLATSLNIAILPVHARWIAYELDLGYCIGVLLAALIFRFGVSWLGKLL